MGWKVGILSGDHSEIVQAVAARLGIAAELARGELLPENKVQVVQGHADAEPVVMIGDGVNDSAALAAASVGIAVRGGAEASLSAASVYLAREGLSDFIALVRLARTTMNTIRWNFAASLGYNALAVGLAATGLIHPLLAAILMPVSSLTVVSISLMLPRDWSRERGISR
jgi:Cu2+-exporting ATPase